MNWLKKNWFIVLVNIIAIFAILFIAELFLYLTSDKQYPFFTLVKDVKANTSYENYRIFYYGSCVQEYTHDSFLYRCPVGLHYKNKPILLFGCAFTWGLDLNEKQTFHYKLSNLTKRPVYNRGMRGSGIQYMLYHLRRNDFYSQVPKPEYVVYIYTKSQIKRMHKYGGLNKEKNRYLYNYLKYNEHFGKLYEEKRFQHIPYSRLWNLKILPYIGKIKENNIEESFKLLEKHLLECRKEIDNHWGKDTKFIVFDYIISGKYIFTNEYIRKLKQNRIDVIRITDLASINFYDELYWLGKKEDQDHHPSEKAWDVITPLFVKKAREIYPDF